jgi:hypothetical protein
MTFSLDDARTHAKCAIFFQRHNAGPLYDIVACWVSIDNPRVPMVLGDGKLSGCKSADGSNALK